MARTFVIGDIHGDLVSLDTLLSRFPILKTEDTIVFLGDYLDRGPDSAGVVERVRQLQTPAKVVALRGNHEDAWLRVVSESWPGFVMPEGNGCRACLKSFMGLEPDATLDISHLDPLFSGSFFPKDVLEWMESLPVWYEDEHAIYVHAGLPQVDGVWQHPRDVEDNEPLLWSRSKSFFLDYKGKTVVVGHTGVSTLPEGRSRYTPDDPTDLYWSGNSAYGIDTGAGKGGFLTALEFPSLQVYESR